MKKYLDPTSLSAQKTSYSGAAGNFSDALYTFTSAGLELDNANFVRGIGLVQFTVNLLTGSSGGFSNSVDLECDSKRLPLPDPRYKCN